MFKSFEWHFTTISNKLIDDEFECLVDVNNWIFESVVREYEARELNVGKNLALATLWFCKTLGHNINGMVQMQDVYCRHNRKKWNEYIKIRNEYLKKLIAWA